MPVDTLTPAALLATLSQVLAADMPSQAVVAVASTAVVVASAGVDTAVVVADTVNPTLND
jgi:hypothetical protein